MHWFMWVTIIWCLALGLVLVIGKVLDKLAKDHEQNSPTIEDWRRDRDET